MKRAVAIAAAIIIVLSLMAAFTPLVSRAAVTPYFIAVDDTLLPFTDANMPFVTGGEIFLPHVIFREVGVWEASSAEAERARLYVGEPAVDFFTSTGITVDQNGNTLNWPPARRIGNVFYVPLRHVCNYFGLTFEIPDVSRNVIPGEQMRVVRIMRPNNWTLNGATLLSRNSRTLRAAYEEYHAPPPQPPVETPPPTYEDVTMYLSFYDLNAGGTDRILDTFDILAGDNHRVGFFVSAKEISENPERVRRISGSGHTVGIWLEEGTFEEYIEASALLFEASKIRTILVSAGEAMETAAETASLYGLIFWGASLHFDSTVVVTETAVTSILPTAGGERQIFKFACSEDLAHVLPGILEHLRLHEYNVAGITETTPPIRS